LDVKAVRSALLRYRVMAYVVGVLLAILIGVGMPLKYLSDNQYLIAIGTSINTVLGIAHGWLYMALLITAVDLGRRVRWTWKRLLSIALAGTVPFLSFVAERFATRDVNAKLIAAVH
jgi:integral membrane protein